MTDLSNLPKTRFPEQVVLLAPRGFNAALNRLADKLHQTKSQTARQAILRELEAHGERLVTVEEPSPPPMAA